MRRPRTVIYMPGLAHLSSSATCRSAADRSPWRAGGAGVRGGSAFGCEVSAALLTGLQNRFRQTPACEPARRVRVAGAAWKQCTRGAGGGRRAGLAGPERPAIPTMPPPYLPLTLRASRTHRLRVEAALEARLVLDQACGGGFGGIQLRPGVDTHAWAQHDHERGTAHRRDMQQSSTTARMSRPSPDPMHARMRAPKHTWHHPGAPAAPRRWRLLRAAPLAPPPSPVLAASAGPAHRPARPAALEPAVGVCVRQRGEGGAPDE